MGQALCPPLGTIPPGPQGSVELLCFPKSVAGAEAGLWPRAAGTGLSLSLSHTHLGLVSMLMYLRSSAAYWAICSGVASSPGYTGSSGAPRVPSGGCSNRATQADRSSRKRQRQAAGIWGVRSKKVRKDRDHLPGPLAHHPCVQAWGGQSKGLFECDHPPPRHHPGEHGQAPSNVRKHSREGGDMGQETQDS